MKTAFLAAAVIILAWPKAATRWWAAPAICAAAALVALSRIAVGAHWPLDVLTGAAGGWLAPAVAGSLLAAAAATLFALGVPLLLTPCIG